MAPQPLPLSRPSSARTPVAQGLYDPANEHDSCGVAFVADVAGRRSAEVVRLGLQALCRMDHRGARGAEQNTGDGAGIMIQIPDELYRGVLPGVELPPAGRYATGLVFLPADPAGTARARRVFHKYAAAESIDVLAWRDVPVNPRDLGSSAQEAMPVVRQVFVAARRDDGSLREGIELDRAVYALRRQTERETRERGVEVHFPSLSARTITYKGMLTPDQLEQFYPDLTDERTSSAIALVHSRFSTNTFPSWPLAHPYRMIAHNGEINTIRGNRNWMAAREALLATDCIPGDLRRLFPICTPGASDSANFDEVLELLNLGGRSLQHAVLMMIPEAWENDAGMDPARRAFYQFHACLMEAWDGPASVAFTDGTVVGAVLDRNGLRPGRWWRTTDGLVVLASEAGVLGLDPATIVAKGRLQPGRMFLVDTAAGRIVSDDEIKADLAGVRPYQRWLDDGLTPLAALPPRPREVFAEDLQRRQLTFGYTEEELDLLLVPKARTGAEPIGSMGTDTPIAPLSTRPRLLYDYFTQLFAQVTNPPLDAIREELVTSVLTTIGPEGNLLAPGADSCRRVTLPYPVIDNDQLAAILGADDDGDRPDARAMRIAGRYRLADGAQGLKGRLVELMRAISEAIEDGVRVFVLSDRGCTAELAPIPSLLLTAAVHEHLIREQTRTRVSLLVESGDCREVHHVAVLLGYGASAVNPYLAFETVEDLAGSGRLGEITAEKAVSNYVKALGKGVLKIMSKMGISTVASYTGAQVFEAVGLNSRFVERYFTGTSTKIEGIGLAEVHAEIAARHARAYPANPAERLHRNLEVGGEYQWRREGEQHLYNPETVFLLQHATRSGSYEVYRQFTAAVDGMVGSSGALRGLFELRTGARPPVPIAEVEPVESIVRRFATGAMSYGSISAEVHTDLAIAMNRLGGRSNTGEGGEDVDRLRDPARRSAIKQVASARFGVTTEYLVQADDLQIKMAQGAKPGEGGQLPGNKVWPWIAKTRHSTPGVGLISPPPHHDIYSIEDLAQLVYDLKSVNPAARVHVKLVSELGVGTVAAGVAKTKADVILISGHEGGTGASPMNSIKHAGAPWELGLAETQQTLLLSGLRDRVVVQVDGQLKTGRDVVVAALLGAEEYGFATAPLVVSGCVMMRVCHLDTCPVGIATQDPQLRKRYRGKPEYIETYFRFLAQEVREILAGLGFRSLDEAVGRVELLDVRPAIEHWKAHGLDLTPLLHLPALPEGAARLQTTKQDHKLDQALDNALIAAASPALDSGTPVKLEFAVRNTHRTVGAMLGGEVVRRRGGDGLPDDTIDITLRGTAGQSFGAFVPRGVTLRLYGDANDYIGKGLSGGRLIVRPDPTAPFARPASAPSPFGGAEDQIIGGNTILYGATGGQLFVRGRVGERFAVRNSGAAAVVEGVGDHGCEYMTGGTVVVLGRTGRNFAAGMSGGQAYLWRADRRLVNAELVDLLPVSDQQAVELRALVAAHHAETDSPVAAGLLARWADAVTEFTAVVPRDYQRVLDAMRGAEEAGEDPAAAVMQLARR